MYYEDGMSDAKTEIVTFRLDAVLKDEFAGIAAEEDKPVGELLREHVKRRKRPAFEAEARRQCEVLNAAARNPDSDEAPVMRELEAHFVDVMREWK